MKLLDAEKLLARLTSWEEGARRDLNNAAVARPTPKISEYKGEADALRSLIVQIKKGDFDVPKKIRQAEQTYFGLDDREP